MYYITVAHGERKVETFKAKGKAQISEIGKSILAEYEENNDVYVFVSNRRNKADEVENKLKHRIKLCNEFSSNDLNKRIYKVYLQSLSGNDKAMNLALIQIMSVGEIKLTKNTIG